MPSTRNVLSRLFLAAIPLAALVACGSGDLSLGQVGSSLHDDGGADASGTCPVGEHECACASGSYCLEMGAMCIAPTSPCPGADASAGDASSACPAGEHECACATGSYCLEMGAMCIAPTSACPTTDAGQQCPIGESACACATGYYCKPIAPSMCINPTAPCPDAG